MIAKRDKERRASNRVGRARASVHSARVGRQQFLVKHEDVIVVHAGIAHRVKRAEYRLVRSSAKNKTQVAAGSARIQNALDRGTRIAEGTVGLRAQFAIVLSKASSRKCPLITSVQRQTKSSSLLAIGNELQERAVGIAEVDAGAGAACGPALDRSQLDRNAMLRQMGLSLP